MIRIVRHVMLMCCLALGSAAFAQTPDTPGEYMEFFTSRSTQLSEKFMSYVSELAHGNRARKMEKRRLEVVAAIRQALGDASRVKPYKGDATLRDAYKNYWDILLKVFNEDYHKIVDMEEIAEQSYDKMEAYLLAQDKAGEVLENASEQIQPIYKSFALRNNITLVGGDDTKLEKKMKQVAKVNNYHRPFYLIFFKNFKQEAYLTEAFNQKDLNRVEQNREALARFANEGLKQLDTAHTFNGDGSLLNACRKYVEYCKDMAENLVPPQSAFLVKQGEFDKVRKAFEAKPAAQRTQADIDAYNKAVNEVNEALALSNKSLEKLNAQRSKVVQGWENASKSFMERHIPRN
ncbi:MAG TPA: hypothetical protein VGK59_09440 [Ohtaekwangia sp.]